MSQGYLAKEDKNVLILSASISLYSGGRKNNLELMLGVGLANLQFLWHARKAVST